MLAVANVTDGQAAERSKGLTEGFTSTLDIGAAFPKVAFRIQAMEFAL
jgi:hypothetical protein